jgi:hypothetical protein
MQELAGEATYARRIAMSGLLGLAADWDDDGKQAKANHAAHKYANDTDRKWCEKAMKALSDALHNADGDALTEIEHKIEKAVKDGHISPASKQMLEEYATRVGEEVTNA